MAGDRAQLQCRPIMLVLMGGEDSATCFGPDPDEEQRYRSRQQHGTADGDGDGDAVVLQPADQPGDQRADSGGAVVREPGTDTTQLAQNQPP